MCILASHVILDGGYTGVKAGYREDMRFIHTCDDADNAMYLVN